MQVRRHHAAAQRRSVTREEIWSYLVVIVFTVYMHITPQQVAQILEYY